jgi:hypothetical protein
MSAKSRSLTEAATIATLAIVPSATPCGQQRPRDVARGANARPRRLESRQSPEPGPTLMHADTANCIGRVGPDAPASAAELRAPGAFLLAIGRSPNRSRDPGGRARRMRSSEPVRLEPGDPSLPARTGPSHISDTKAWPIVVKMPARVWRTFNLRSGSSDGRCRRYLCSSGAARSCLAMGCGVCGCVSVLGAFVRCARYGHDCRDGDRCGRLSHVRDSEQQWRRMLGLERLRPAGRRQHHEQLDACGGRGR